MKNDIYKFNKVYNCECCEHLLNVTQFNEENDNNIYLNKFERISHWKPNILQRLKLALNYVLNPLKYDIHRDIVLNPKTAKELARDLLNITQPKTNIITGRKKG
jgi:hypothetical protein